MRTIDERERSDTRCDVMRWSNSDVEIRIWKMPNISVEENENNRWMRNAKNKKAKLTTTKKTKTQRKEQGETDVIVRERAKWLCSAFKFSPINIKSFFNL